MTRRRDPVPWWVWVVLGVVVAVVPPILTYEPLHTCGDGEDAQGRPTGGCYVDGFRFADDPLAVLLWVGAAAVVVFCIVRIVRALRRSKGST